MKTLKTLFDEQRDEKSSRGKKSKLGRKRYVHCQNVIFWFAAVVLIVLFIQQVSDDMRIDVFLSS